MNNLRLGPYSVTHGKLKLCTSARPIYMAYFSYLLVSNQTLSYLFVYMLFMKRIFQQWYTFGLNCYVTAAVFVI